MRRLKTSTRFAGLIAVLVLATGITAASALAVASQAGTSQRGALHVTKECSEYKGTVGGFCTITSSNISAIRAGMRVVYLAVPANGRLDSDIILVSPRERGFGGAFGYGSVAFGHVLLDLTTAQGRVTFSGGTGTLAGFQADVAVSVDSSGVWHWDGTYSVSPPAPFGSSVNG